MAGVSVGPYDPIRRVFESEAPGRKVRLRGWLQKGRSSGGILFLLLRDRTGVVQATLVRDRLGDAAFESAEHVQTEGSLAVEGTVHEDKRAPGGREVKVDAVTVLDPGSPFPIFSGQTEEFLLDKRHLAIRSPEFVAVFRVKACLMRAYREFLFREDVLEVTPPILGGNAAEGGAEAFQLDYFGRPGYLAQTAQLYLEALLAPHERVYSITTSFRAEKSRTPRHLTEYTHLEVELAYCDLAGLMDFTERLVVSGMHALADEVPKELTLLGRPPEELRKIKAPFPRITYAEAIERLQTKGFPVQFGSDLGTAEERALTLTDQLPLFVTGYPIELKAFYMLKSASDPRTVDAMDMLGSEGYGEIVGGSARETDVARLEERLRQLGVDPKEYEWYLDLRRHGSVPHAGFGIGLERMVRWITRREHIRDATPFPRTPSRFTP